MSPHAWEGGSIIVEDRHGDPIELTTFRCHRCGSIATVRGSRSFLPYPTDWELEANEIVEDCDLESAKSIMES